MVTRHALRSVRDALGDTPAVLVLGPRQAGKSTLVEAIAREHPEYRYVTLDDPVALAEARHRPGDFLDAQGVPLVIDEVQRAPELFLAMKLRIDRNRTPGMYLMTGSANVLLMPKVADSLAGRMEPIDLLPFSQAELEGSEGNFVDRVFEGSLPTRGTVREDDRLLDRITRGGYPEPALRSSPQRRAGWFTAYMRTLLERDVRDLANIEGLTQLPRLFALLAARSGETLNISSLGRDTGIPHTTLTRYLDLLRALFLLREIPAWSIDVDRRFLKTAKAYLADTGLLCHLTRMDERALRADRERFAKVLKSFAAMEILKLAQLSETRPWLMHLRTVRQKEVDFLLERGDGRLVGVQVLATPNVQPEDVEGLRYLEELAEDRFERGVLLTLGTDVQPIASRIVAMPIQSLWS
jgi:uncharacterized protein